MRRQALPYDESIGDLLRHGSVNQFGDTRLRRAQRSVHRSFPRHAARVRDRDAPRLVVLRYPASLKGTCRRLCAMLPPRHAAGTAGFLISAGVTAFILDHRGDFPALPRQLAIAVPVSSQPGIFCSGKGPRAGEPVAPRDDRPGGQTVPLFVPLDKYGMPFK